jgi:hypothetical protein
MNLKKYKVIKLTISQLNASLKIFPVQSLKSERALSTFYIQGVENELKYAT